MHSPARPEPGQARSTNKEISAEVKVPQATHSFLPPRGHGHAGNHKISSYNAKSIHHVLEPRSRHGCNATGNARGAGRGNADKARVAQSHLECGFLLQHCSCTCTARPSASCVAFFWRLAGLPPQIGMMPVGAPAFGGCLMAVPGPPSTAPQNTETPSTAAPSTAAPKAKASPEAQHEANTFEVPVRGRDVPHPRRGRSQSTAPQRASSSRGYYDAGQGVIWHQDRSGRFWSSTARDDQRGDAQHSNWQSNWWDDRDWWSWSSTPHSNWNWDHDAWHSTTRDSPRHSPAPQPEQVHGNVLHEGWQASLLVDRPVLHNRGRPYYVGARGQYLCGIACTASHCNYSRMPCNSTIRDLASDWHTGHKCSFCRRDREQRRNASRRDDP